MIEFYSYLHPTLDIFIAQTFLLKYFNTFLGDELFVFQTHKKTSYLLRVMYKHRVMQMRKHSVKIQNMVPFVDMNFFPL